jgi:ABC-type branched-subunit amino acid transport system ATPase component
MASIRTAGLAKNFGDLRAVNEIDLDLPEGGVAGFVGPNGAGKSTTIRMLLGLITPTGGEGEVFGHPIGRPAAYLHRVGALIEAPAFYPALTGEANLTELTAGRRRAGTALPRHLRRLRHDGPYPPDRRTGPSHRIRSCPDRPPHRRLRRDRGLDPHARRP